MTFPFRLSFRKDVHTLHTAEVFKVKQSVSRCLKMIEKVSFNITSEASYVHVWSGQKLIKKKPNIWSILWGFDEIFLGDFPTMCVSCNSCKKVSSPSRLSLDL